MIKIRFHPALYAYLLSMIVLSSWETSIGALAALLTHELGHLVVCRFVHEKIEKLELTPFGGVMVYPTGKSPSKGIRGFCITVAGPAANYILLAYISMNQPRTAIMHSIALSCAVMLLINTIPALPLDGGRMAFSIGYYIFPVTFLISLLTCLGIAAGIIFVILAVYGFVFYKILNCSVLIVGGYLIYSAWKNREQMLLENSYAVIQEAIEDKKAIQKIKRYIVPADIPLIQLLSYIERRYACEFIFESNEGQHCLSEKQLCRILLEKPTLSIKELFSKNIIENRTFSP